MNFHSVSLQRGISLIELVISIVVIAVGLAGIIVAINRNVRSSADPMVQHQAVALAEAYLEEILLKDFCDPDNATPCTRPNAPGSANCVVCPAAEGARTSFDNVCDYNGLTDNPPVDQTGTTINSLANYTVQTNVSTTDSIGPGGNQAAGGSCELLRVEVIVTGASGVSFTLGGYRTNF